MFKSHLFLKLMLLIATLMGTVNANDTSNQVYNQKAQVILETIQDLEKIGYITNKNALEAKKELVFSKPELLQSDTSIKDTAVGSEVSWTEYLSLINIMKVMAVIFLLIAFKGVVFKFIKLFTSIPQYVYQTLTLAFSVILTFYPELIWASEASYLSIFGVIANIVIIVWIIATYEEFFTRLFKMLSLNMPPEIVASVYATLYFGFFAIYLDSSLLGIVASMSFVSIFGFSMATSGVCTYIGYDSDDYIGISLVNSLFVVTAFSIINIMGITLPYIDVFTFGIQYILTIVLVITLLIQSSFVYENDKMFGLSVFLFIMVFIGANVGSFVFNLEVIPSIVNTGFLLFFLGWLHYFTFKVSGILTMFVAAITLYVSALMLEAYPEYFVTSLF